jgi:DNA-directed RNA polymerase specialized sigma24 family protein
MAPGLVDPADAIARVATAHWQRLLRIHYHRLTRADLEDCLAQATLELLVAARAGERFAEDATIVVALDRRFQSRIIDRQRALAGRSPIIAATCRATPIDTLEDTLPAAGGDPLAQVLQREQFDRLAAAIRKLTVDQRLVLRHQLHGRERPGEFCARHGWSVEKYRKTAQRASARLRQLTR